VIEGYASNIDSQDLIHNLTVVVRSGIATSIRRCTLSRVYAVLDQVDPRVTEAGGSELVDAGTGVCPPVIEVSSNDDGDASRLAVDCRKNLIDTCRSRCDIVAVRAKMVISRRTSTRLSMNLPSVRV
jgi:hypothetical protein